MQVQSFISSIVVFCVFNFVEASDAKVKVDVYYETLCPDSIGFLIRKLTPNYELISEMIELNLVPFGKAEVYEYRDRVDFYCHHGPKECRGNMIHACALNEYKNNFTLVLPFIECMEYDLMGKPKPNVDQFARDCAKENEVSWDQIETCINGSVGQQLLMEAGKKTKAMRPKISFVPTVVINEKYTDANQNKALYGDFVKLICSNYAASSTISGCTSDV